MFFLPLTKWNNVCDFLIGSLDDERVYKRNPKKLIQFSPSTNPKHLVGKWTVQNDTIKDITSDPF